MKTAESITLESLGLVASIVSNGIREKDGQYMLAYNALFTRTNGKSQAFDYFVGVGCVPWDKIRSTDFRLSWQEQQVVELRQKRFHIKDKLFLATTAAKIAFLTKWKPDPIEILHCIAMESDSLDMTFPDWAMEFGYDGDSIKAKETYEACQQEAIRLKSLIGSQAMESLRALEI